MFLACTRVATFQNLEILTRTVTQQVTSEIFLKSCVLEVQPLQGSTTHLVMQPEVSCFRHERDFESTFWMEW
jgi:hypothetical protein